MVSGSVVLHNPVYNLGGHEQDDLEPRRWCCTISNQCHLYTMYRPPVSCTDYVAINTGTLQFTWWSRPDYVFFYDTYNRTLPQMNQPWVASIDNSGCYQRLRLNLSINMKYTWWACSKRSQVYMFLGKVRHKWTNLGLPTGSSRLLSQATGQMRLFIQWYT